MSVVDVECTSAYPVLRPQCLRSSSEDNKSLKKAKFSIVAKKKAKVSFSIRPIVPDLNLFKTRWSILKRLYRRMALI